MPDVWVSRWWTVTSGRSVAGRRSGGSSAVTGADRSPATATAVTAVNIFVSDASPKRVPARTGIPAARWASP